MKMQARLPTEFHYWEKGAIPLDWVNGFQTVAWRNQLRDWPRTLVQQEAGKYTGWNPGSVEVHGKTPTDFRQVWDFTRYIFVCEGSNPIPDPVPPSQVCSEPLVRDQWPLQSCNIFPPTISPWAQGRWTGWRTLKCIAQNQVERKKSDNMEQLLCYQDLDYAACCGGALLNTFWKQIWLITTRAGWLTVLWKYLLTTQWHLKRTDRRDAQNKKILKRIVKGSETKAINLSTVLQNNSMVLPVHEFRDRESAEKWVHKPLRKKKKNNKQKPPKTPTPPPWASIHHLLKQTRTSSVSQSEHAILTYCFATCLKKYQNTFSQISG